ncbi:MAG: RNA polymerase sigma factor SigF [Actinobacteria bacterium]|nr:RNA polymerase sigma factor SigF [Actinomycetota bacterium]MCB9413513.1 RNA polymerase sigma factor SigF [Actinomycetota bacterium]
MSTPRAAAKDYHDAELLATVADPDATPEDVAEAREQLVKLHMPLVAHIVRRFTDRGEPTDDLMQVGSIGLLKAIDRFDASRGAGFATYATPTIIGEIKRHFRDRGWSVKVPRRLQDLGIKIRRTREELTNTLGRSPTVAEVAEALGVDEDDVLEALESAQAYSSASLEAPSEHDSRGIGDSLGTEDLEISLVVDRETLRPALAALEPRQRQILVMRFFGHKTQSEIAESLGISQVHVSRLLSKTLAELRETLGEDASE